MAFDVDPKAEDAEGGSGALALDVEPKDEEAAGNSVEFFHMQVLHEACIQDSPHPPAIKPEASALAARHSSIHLCRSSMKHASKTRRLHQASGPKPMKLWPQNLPQMYCASLP